MGTLAKWVPSLPAGLSADSMLGLLDARRAIVDRVGAWEEMNGLAQIYDATVEQLNEQLATPEAVSWKGRKWQGQRDREVARASNCRRLMAQFEMEVVVWYQRFSELSTAAKSNG